MRNYCRGGTLPPDGEDPVPLVPEGLVGEADGVVEGLIPGVLLGI